MDRTETQWKKDTKINEALNSYILQVTKIGEL